MANKQKLRDNQADKFSIALKEYRKSNGYTQEAFAEILGINRGVLANYEIGATFPDFRTLLSIIKKTNKDANYFVGISNKVTTDLPKIGGFSENGVQILPIIVDQNGQEGIPYVPIAAQAGYLSGYQDPEWVAKLPNLVLTGFVNGTYRAFEVKGHSMDPTVIASDRVIGRYVDNLKRARPGEVHVVVMKSDGIVVKRVYFNDSRSSTILQSDNNAYDPFKVSSHEILEMWRLEGIIRVSIPAPVPVIDRRPAIGNGD